MKRKRCTSFPQAAQSTRETPISSVNSEKQKTMPSLDVWIFLLNLADGTSLLFLTVYFIITLSDLECDYINATLCCSKLNKWVLPDLVAQALTTLALLVSWHWVLFILNVPMTAWQIYRYVTMPSGNMGMYDPAEIHNRQLLKGYMKEVMVKLGYHLVFFFIYLYSLIIALLS